MDLEMKFFVLLTLFFLSACKFEFDWATPKPPPPPPNPLAGCWDPNVKTEANGIAQQIASTNFNKSLPTTMNDTDQKQVESSFVLTLSEFQTFGYDKNSGALTCAAGYKYVYTRPDNSTYTHDDGDILMFEVHQGEDGLDASVSGTDSQSLTPQYQVSGDGSDQ